MGTSEVSRETPRLYLVTPPLGRAGAIADELAAALNAADIAAVPGIDVLLIGTNDLCAEIGIHGDFGNEKVAEAYKAMIAACKQHGKFPGMAGIYNEQIMPRYIEMGARFILSGADAAFLMASATQRTGFLRTTFSRA